MTNEKLHELARKEYLRQYELAAPNRQTWLVKVPKYDEVLHHIMVEELMNGK